MRDFYSPRILPVKSSDKIYLNFDHIVIVRELLPMSLF
jgi:hypothetical protein